jgi:hypothetical protein
MYPRDVAWFKTLFLVVGAGVGEFAGCGSGDGSVTGRTWSMRWSDALELWLALRGVRQWDQGADAGGMVTRVSRRVMRRASCPQTLVDKCRSGCGNAVEKMAKSVN